MDATTLPPIEDVEPISEPPVSNGLQVVSIAKSYDKRVVLTDVSVSVGRGEVVGLLGPNGAGKTTCFYSVMGLVKPDSGRIMLDGEDITKLPMYRRAILGLGYLPQETSIFRGLTIEKNILTVLELSEPDKAARQRKLDTLLEEFGLTRLRAAPAMALSRAGGGSVDHAARRAVRGHRPHFDRRHPRFGEGPQTARHRRANHRPQRPRDAGNRRPRVYHL
jgi:lipopolysaccharide export system ATP-binding protein